MRQEPTVDQLKIQLQEVIQEIEKLERQQDSGYTAQVAKSFHLGRVGGSGRRTASLNKRRSRELDKTIDIACKIVPLYKLRDGLKARIEYIESGQAEKQKEARAKENQTIVDWWNNLKPGDSVPLFTGNRVTIKKKNKKSIICTSDITWSAKEILGNERASLL